MIIDCTTKLLSRSTGWTFNEIGTTFPQNANVVLWIVSPENAPFIHLKSSKIVVNLTGLHCNLTLHLAKHCSEVWTLVWISTKTPTQSPLTKHCSSQDDSPEMQSWQDSVENLNFQIKIFWKQILLPYLRNAILKESADIIVRVVRKVTTFVSGLAKVQTLRGTFQNAVVEQNWLCTFSRSETSHFRLSFWLVKNKQKHRKLYE